MANPLLDYLPQKTAGKNPLLGYLPKKAPEGASNPLLDYLPKQPGIPQVQDPGKVTGAGLAERVSGINMSDISPENFQRLGASYWPQRAFSQLAQIPQRSIRQLLPMAGKGLAAGAKFFAPEASDQWINENVISNLNKHIENLDPYKGDTATRRTHIERQLRREEIYTDKGFGLGIANDILEAGADLGALFGTMKLIRGVPAVGKFLSKGGKITEGIKAARLIPGEKGAKMLRGLERLQYYQNAKLFGIHGFLTTSGDIKDRTKAATFRMMYNLTPVLAKYVSHVKGIDNQILIKGMDAAFNMVISSGAYKQALDMSDGDMKKFISGAIPTFLTDIAFSLKTTGYRSDIKAHIRHTKQWPLVKKNKTSSSITGKPFESEKQFNEEKDAFEALFIKQIIDRDEVAEKLREVGNLKETQSKDLGLPPMINGVGTERAAKEIVPRVAKEMLKGVKGMEKQKHPFEGFAQEIQNDLRTGIDAAIARGVTGKELDLVVRDTLDKSMKNTIYHTGGYIEGKPNFDFEGKHYTKNTVDEGTTYKQLLIDLKNQDRSFEDLRIISNIGPGSDKAMRENAIMEVMGRRAIKTELRVEPKITPEGQPPVAPVKVPAKVKAEVLGVKPKDEPLGKWDQTKFEKAKADNNKDMSHIPVVEKNLTMVKPVATTSKGRDSIIVDSNKVNKLYDKYMKGEKILLHKLAKIPPGLTQPEFKNFVIEHERTHLTTGLDGGKASEDMVNALALMKIGKFDQANELYKQAGGVGEIKSPLDKVKEAIPPQESRETVIHKSSEENTSEDPIRVEERAQETGTEELQYRPPDNTISIRTTVEPGKISHVMQDFFSKHKLQSILYDNGEFDPLTSHASLSPQMQAKLQHHMTENGILPRVRMAQGSEGEINLKNVNDPILAKIMAESANRTPEQVKHIYVTDLYDRMVRTRRKMITDATRGKSVEQRYPMSSQARDKLPKIELKRGKGWVEVPGRPEPVPKRGKRLPREYSKRLRTWIDDIWWPEMAKDTSEKIRSELGDDYYNKFNNLVKDLGGKKRPLGPPDPQHPGERAELQDQDSFPNAPIEDQPAPAVGRDGKDAQRFSTKLRVYLRASKFMGLDEPWLRDKMGPDWWARELEIGEAQFQIKNVSPETRSAIIQSTLSGKRYQGYIAVATAGMRDIIYNGVKEEVDLMHPLWSKEQKNDLASAYRKIAKRSLEEIHHNEGDPLGTYALTGNGAGGKFASPKQEAAFNKHYVALGNLIGRPNTAQATRPTKAYFDMLTPQLQMLTDYIKMQIHNPLLREQIASGVFADSNIRKIQQQGFTHGYWRPTETQKSAGMGGGLRDPALPPKKYPTYDEFYEESLKQGLVVSDDVATTTADYMAESLSRIDQQRQLNLIKSSKNPENENMPLVIFEGQQVFGKTKVPGDAWHKTAEENGYVEMKNAPGLREGRGPFRPPYVHKSAAAFFNSFYAPKTRSARMQALLTLNHVIKRSVMFSPHMWMTQILSTPMLWMGKGNKWWKYVVKPIVSGEVFRKGPKEGMKVLDGKNDPWHWLDKSVDPVRLTRFLKNGMPIHIRQSMELLFDVERAAINPNERSKFENVKEYILGKAGIDTYAFGKIISRAMYEFASSMTDRFESDGMSPEDAARRASFFCSTTMGMPSSSIYGQERDFLQALFFARDFTVTLVRQATGAVGIHPEYKAGIEAGSWRNAFVNADISKADMQSLQPYFAKQLIKVALAKVAFVAVAQFMLTQTWPWDNEPKKKLMIKMPMKDEQGNQLYLDPLIFREASQLVDILPRIGKLRDLSRGPMNLFKSKLSSGINIALEWMSNTDWSGREITKNSEAISFAERSRDRLKHAFESALPTPLRSDIRQPLGKFLGTGLMTAGIPTKRGVPGERGFTAEEYRNIRDVVDRDAYRKEQLKRVIRKYRSVDDFIKSKEAKRYMMQWGMSARQIKNLYQKEAAPISTLIRQHRGILRRAPNWMEE